MEDINKLRKEVEIKFGRKIINPSDFDALYLAIKRETRKEISVSTLKRLWGYVKYDSKPRVEILSILSRYLGFTDWQDFLNSDRISDISEFLNQDIIESKDLESGDILHLNWAPNRICKLKYLNDATFIVIEAENSKIQKDDVIRCNIFVKGEPMLCSSIQRNDKIIAECYVAARRRGIQTINLIKKK